jgi:FMN phosphatase YigB (HAD superfamily)
LVWVWNNVDTAVFARTRASRFFEPEHVFTSERLGVYKPYPAIYERARDACSALVHVASSARDVRGALESGIRVIRLRRPGHELDPTGPVPGQEAASLADLETLLRACGAEKSSPVG